MNALVLQLLVLEVVTPLVLIALNAFLPTASLVGLLLRSAAIGLLVVYVGLAGVWLFPPAWTPYCLLALHLVGSLLAYKKHRKRHAAFGGSIRWSERVAAVSAVTLMATALVPVIEGRMAPSNAIDLAMPLEEGTYLVTSGGLTAAVNAHLATLTGERFRPFRGQSYAVDLIGVDALGFRARGIAPHDPKAYVIYRARILAPCAGVVLGAMDGLPDMTVPEMDREHLTGNRVLLGCGDHIVVLAHMAPGSVAVSVGQSVETGHLLGRVGNSGNTAEPHLHIHVQSGMPEGMPIGGEPVWFTINGKFLLRNDTVRG